MASPNDLPNSSSPVPSMHLTPLLSQPSTTTTDSENDDPSPSSSRRSHPTDRRRRKKTSLEFRNTLALKSNALQPFGSTLKPDLAVPSAATKLSTRLFMPVMRERWMEDPFRGVKDGEMVMKAERWRRGLEILWMLGVLGLSGLAIFGARWIVFEFADPRLDGDMAVETTGLLFSCIIEPNLNKILDGTLPERTCKSTFFMHCGWHGNDVLVKACQEIRSSTASACVGMVAQTAGLVTLLVELFGTFHKEGPPLGARAVTIATSIAGSVFFLVTLVLAIMVQWDIEASFYENVQLAENVWQWCGALGMSALLSILVYLS
ncbi:hypothetical protein BC829DRAFT_491096 [Chytridium lagenaria]|nr:hypothetical protein BC829DRAFT_491096 [Chytridium lagenaria]